MISNNKYSKMQESHFDKQASMWSLEDKNKIVGSFDKHNNHKDYEYLWKDIKGSMKKMDCLDFACGVGRNIVKWNDRFNQIDGIDISQINIDKAKIWLEYNDIKNYRFYKCNGCDLKEIKDEWYNVVMSTIALQHIAVYDIRFNYFKEFYRVLKDKGYLTFQMGFGYNEKLRNKYYDNNYSENKTGGGGYSDVEVKCPMQIVNDLKIIGYEDINYYIRHAVPGNYHKSAIFVNAQKKEC